MIEWLRKFFKRERVSHYTTDGGVLAPHPNMTDDDLRDFESFFKIPTSFKGT